MSNQSIKYGILLTKEQLDFLRMTGRVSTA